ncbi:MAG: tRNA (adenosine(37)-N6)-dimethylallyltransferase MiaA [Clostridia bacterium]|nr:tRNA (adenosine(37)-N6)-dimethylallyltransferase MiaA [Clostridia bacterium]
MKKRFTAIVGATASGKSSLALQLAKKYSGEIVSCDSMQIYKYMDVGTAKPSPEELAAVPHHLIDFVPPDGEYSAGDYAADAAAAIDGVISRGNLPIVCGGTFLYLDSLTEVSSLSESSKDEDLRKRLEKYASENGNGALHEMLEGIDPESAAAIHENNVKRVIRAIEIYETTGKTKSEWDRLSKENESRYSALRIAVSFHKRELLYRRIDERVDLMMENGLFEEARRLYEAGYLAPDMIASQAIGYKEFIDCFEGKGSLEDAVGRIKQSSRNYAKRQLTWLKRYKDLHTIWRDTEEGVLKSADEVFADTEKILSDEGMTSGF